MELAEIIKNRGLTVAQAAEQIGITKAYVYQIIAGRHVGRKAASKIERWSDGAITAASLMTRGMVDAPVAEPEEPSPTTAEE